MKQLALAFLLLLLLAAACSSNSADVVSEDARDLEAGTTLHMVVERYRRYGPAAEIYAQYFPESGPETLTHETWVRFGDDGSIISFRSESRYEDGSLYQAASLDGSDVVTEDANGVEQRRDEGVFSVSTVEEYKKAAAGALDDVRAELTEHPDAPTTTLHGYELRVIEERSPSRTSPPASPSSYSAPYLYDLQPVAMMRRHYYSPDIARGFRSEVWVVDAAGNETLVEYSDHLVHEILEN